MNVLNMSKKKTKMCSNIINRGTCVHGTKCFFAHSLSEITPNTCGYGDGCIHIKINSKNRKLCSFIHPNETISSYHERIHKETNNLNSLKMFDFVTAKDGPLVSETFTIKDELQVLEQSNLEDIVPVKVTLSKEKQDIPEWILIGSGKKESREKQKKNEINQPRYLKLKHTITVGEPNFESVKECFGLSDISEEIKLVEERKERVKVVVVKAENLLSQASSWLEETVSELRITIQYK